MKNILSLLILLISSTAFAQQVSWQQWEQESKTNIRLLPKYGNIKKTKAQIESDQAFIETCLKQDLTPRKASDRLIATGFQYLYSDTKTAMYRFNQAYLLDSTNTDIYWGYGAVYMILGQSDIAKEQYEEGLKINPNNTHLLTDYGTYYLSQYYALERIVKEVALQSLDTAVQYMTKSYELNPKDENTTFKLSIIYWKKGDCDLAWKFYDECMALGGRPISEGYTKALESTCKRKED